MTAVGEREVFFIRHGESEANALRIFAGQGYDCFLTEKGREQAREAAAELLARGLCFDRIICSPLLRAKETAHIIVSRMKLWSAEVVYDPRVAEYDMGVLSGKPWGKMSSREMVSVDDAEDPTKFSRRVKEVLEELKLTNDRVLIVSHAGVGRMYKAQQLGMNPADFYSIAVDENAAVVRIVLSDSPGD